MGTLDRRRSDGQASVTEDVTGAIADSINFTVDELRKVVSDINATTGEVAGATQAAEAISQRLYLGIATAIWRIQRSSALVLQMAQSINECQPRDARRESGRTVLNVAEKGSLAVQNQIAGMNEIGRKSRESQAHQTSG